METPRPLVTNPTISSPGTGLQHFEKSDYIYLAGDAVESIGIVVAGTVQMIKEDIMGDKSIITTMGSGSIFAENFLGHDKQDEKTNVSYFDCQ